MNNLETLLQDAYERVRDSDDQASTLASVLSDDDISLAVFDAVINADEIGDEKAYDLAEENLSSLVSYLQLQNVSEDEFYQRLWDQVSGGAMFVEDDMKRAAMLALLLNPSFPYYQLAEFRMEWDEYSRRVGALQAECEKIQSLLYRDFENAGSASAAMLDVITAPKDDRDKVTLLAYLVSQLKNDDEFEGSAD